MRGPTRPLPRADLTADTRVRRRPRAVRACGHPARHRAPLPNNTQRLSPPGSAGARADVREPAAPGLLERAHADRGADPRRRRVAPRRAGLPGRRLPRRSSGVRDPSPGALVAGAAVRPACACGRAAARAGRGYLMCVGVRRRLAPRVPMRRGTDLVIAVPARGYSSARLGKTTLCAPMRRPPLLTYGIAT
jgi:hypothetical protein